MNNNKTAVEWLFQKLWDEPKDKFTWYAILKEAKEMEKKQIIDAGNYEYYLTGEQYYNEKYGGQNNEQQ